MREKIPITNQLEHILPSNIGFHQPAVFCSMTSVISILPSVQYNYYPVVITKTNSDFRRRPKRFDKVKQRTAIHQLTIQTGAIHPLTLFTATNLSVVNQDTTNRTRMDGQRRPTKKWTGMLRII